MLFGCQLGFIRLSNDQKHLYELTNNVMQRLVMKPIKVDVNNDGSQDHAFSYYDIRTVDHMYMWMRQSLSSFLEFLANPSADSHMKEGALIYNLKEPADESSSQDGGLRGIQGWQGTTNVVGQVRFRQLRIYPNASCTLEGVESSFSACYGRFSSDNENTDKLEIDPAIFPNPVWHSATSLEEDHGTGTVVGKYGVYTGSGFIHDVGVKTYNLQNFESAVDLIQKTKFIDSLTKAVFVSFNLYTPQNRGLAGFQFYFEFDQAGLLYPQFHFMPITVHSTFISNVVLYILLVCLIVHLLVKKVLYYRAVTLKGIGKGQRLKLGKDIADFTIIASFIIGASLRIVIRLAYANIFKKIDSSDFYYLGGYYTLKRLRLFFDLVVVFVSFLRMMSVIVLTPVGYFMSHTLNRIFFPIVGYTALSVVAFFSFVVLSIQIWGRSIFEFTSLFTSAQMLLRMFNGNGKEYLLESPGIQTNFNGFGKLFYIVFVLSITIYFSAIIMATIVNTFLEVRSELAPYAKVQFTSPSSSAVSDDTSGANGSEGGATLDGSRAGSSVVGSRPIAKRNASMRKKLENFWEDHIKPKSRLDKKQ